MNLPEPLLHIYPYHMGSHILYNYKIPENLLDQEWSAVGWAYISEYQSISLNFVRKHHKNINFESLSRNKYIKNLLEIFITMSEEKLISRDDLLWYYHNIVHPLW